MNLVGKFNKSIYLVAAHSYCALSNFPPWAEFSGACPAEVLTLDHLFFGPSPLLQAALPLPKQDQPPSYKSIPFCYPSYLKNFAQRNKKKA